MASISLASYGAPTFCRVPDRINPLDSKGTVTFSPGKNPYETIATFSAPGVYQIRCTLGSGDNAPFRQSWVYVWDNVSVLTPGKIGGYPDCTPPASVRRLAPDPGPFQHPRLLFTNGDWPEVSERNKNGKLASFALAVLKQNQAKDIDDPSSEVGKLAAQLDDYAKSGYKANPPDAKEIVAKHIYKPLYMACYVTWLERDPNIPMSQQPPETIQRGQRLARILAAAAHLHFAAVYDRKTHAINTNKDDPLFINNLNRIGWPSDFTPIEQLPYCYDFIYDWMDDDQRREVRDFLYAFGYGRHFSYGYVHGIPADGDNQNGDFGNQNDNGIPMQLVVEGEESAVSPDVVQTFGTPDPKSDAAQWMKPSDPADFCAWPHSTVASVDNLHRELRMLNEWFQPPSGFPITHIAYLGLSTTWFLRASVCFAHRGENIFATTNYYNTVMGDFYTLEPGEKEAVSPTRPEVSTMAEPNFRTFLVNCDHHDGGHGRPLMYWIWKYMYPDDALIDYDYRAFLPLIFNNTGHLSDPDMASMFGVDPGINGKELSLEETADIKQLPLLKFHPFHSIAISRNTWNADDLNIWFDCDWNSHVGHQHAEKNSFSMYALGRMWCVPPGYHCTISDLQNQVLIQDVKLTYDKATDGYIGESPSSATDTPPCQGNFPTPPGKLLEVSESPDHLYTTFAGDATTAYCCGLHGPRDVDLGKKTSDFMYPGLVDYYQNTFGNLFTDRFNENVHVSSADYNPVQYAIRTVLLVRGKRPYVLSVDDIKKDDTPHNYRWNMNDAEGFAAGQDNKFIGPEGKTVYSSLVMEPGSTSTQAIFRHSPIDDDPDSTNPKPGLPRLLIRELSLEPTAQQPPINLQTRPPGPQLGDADHPAFTYGIDNNSHKFTFICSNCVQIDRNNVVEPHYTVLLFPYRTGEALPAATWSPDRSKLKVDLGDGVYDILTFDRTNPDHRTRVKVQRFGHDINPAN